MSKKRAEVFLRPYFDDLYAAIVSGAQDDYTENYTPKAKAVHDPSIRAQCRNGHMRDRLTLLAAANPRKMRAFKSEGLIGIVIEETISVIAKKLDPDLRTRNNMTPHFERYLNQSKLPGIDGTNNFVIGYTEDPMTGALTGIHMTYPKSKYGRHYEFTLNGAGAASTVIELFGEVEMPDISQVQELHEKEEQVEKPTIANKSAPADILKFEKKDEPDTK
jgi:hypothetical protein